MEHIVTFFAWILGFIPLPFSRRLTRARGSLAELQARYPRSTVRRAEIVWGDWASEPYLEMVEFVVGNRQGLSFRDGYGHEELQVPASVIAKLDLISKPGDQGQHVMVLDEAGNALADFWSPEDAGDVRAALTEALRG